MQLLLIQWSQVTTELKQILLQFKKQKCLKKFGSKMTLISCYPSVIQHLDNSPSNKTRIPKYYFVYYMIELLPI